MHPTRQNCLTLCAAITLLAANVSLSRQTKADNCTLIEALPVSITAPGCYKLSEDFYLENLDADAISISANDVEINLNQKSIVQRSTPSTTNNGIYANTVKDVVIRNGRIEGFFYAIRIDGGTNSQLSENITIKNVSLDKNYFRGVMVQGRSVSVERTSITYTGGSDVFPDAFAMSIEISGPNCVVRENLIRGLYTEGIGEEVGISLSSKRDGCVVEKNIIDSSMTDGGTFGIWMDVAAAHTIIRNNHIIGFMFPYNIPNSESARPLITENRASDIKCRPDNYPMYYRYLPPGNQIETSDSRCTYLIEERSTAFQANSTDPRAIFQLAVSKYNCAYKDEPDPETCCAEQKSAISYYEIAVKLGFHEAIRVVDAVKRAVHNSPYCRSFKN